MTTMTTMTNDELKSISENCNISAFQAEKRFYLHSVNGNTEWANEARILADRFDARRREAMTELRTRTGCDCFALGKSCDCGPRVWVGWAK